MTAPQKPRLKKGAKVRVRETGQIGFVHYINRGRPYPYYIHADEDAAEDAQLDGPYTAKELEVIANGQD